MAKKPESTQTIRWDIFKAGAKLRPLGTVEAPDEVAAIEKAAAEFKVPASKLIAVRGDSSVQHPHFETSGRESIIAPSRNDATQEPVMDPPVTRQTGVLIVHAPKTISATSCRPPARGFELLLVLTRPRPALRLFRWGRGLNTPH